MSIFQRHKTVADRSANDRARHRKKIEHAIKEGIHHIVAEESIIGKDGKKKFKIPVRGIKEHRFVYGENGTHKVGSAHGKDLERGQVIGQKEEQQGGKPDKAGDSKGEEYYEIELTLEQLAEYLFKDLELPNFEKKQSANVISKKIKRRGYRTKGIRPRLDKKKTVIQKLKRKQKAQYSGTLDEDNDEFSFHERDLRYRHYKVHEKKTSNAAILFLMDISGSMTKEKKFLARSFFFLLYHFIGSRYDSVEITFLAHDVDAYEVNEEQFFTRGSSGGTMVSSVLNLADEIITSRYHPSSWNVYTFQCSDGDNWPADNERSVDAIGKIIKKCQFVGYCEIEPSQERIAWLNETVLYKAYQPLEGPEFKCTEIHNKEDIWTAFNSFFGGQYG